MNFFPYEVLWTTVAFVYEWLGPTCNQIPKNALRGYEFVSIKDRQMSVT